MECLVFLRVHIARVHQIWLNLGCSNLFLLDLCNLLLKFGGSGAFHAVSGGARLIALLVVDFIRVNLLLILVLTLDFIIV